MHKMHRASCNQYFGQLSSASMFSPSDHKHACAHSAFWHFPYRSRLGAAAEYWEGNGPGLLVAQINTS